MSAVPPKNGPVTDSFRRHWRFYRTEGGARYLRGPIWEVRADSVEVTLRTLFAKQGRYGQVLLALHVFKKKTQQTPPAAIELAERRLRDWTHRGRFKRTRPS